MNSAAVTGSARARATATRTASPATSARGVGATVREPGLTQLYASARTSASAAPRNTRWLWAGCALLLLVAVSSRARTAGSPDDTAPSQLAAGMELSAAVELESARVYPLEPMSPTSPRCAFKLVHRSSGVWIEAFPNPGSQRPPSIDNGDVHLPDGRRQMTPPPEVEPELAEGWTEFERRVNQMTGDELVESCHAMDPGLYSWRHFAAFAALALLLLISAAVVQSRSAVAAAVLLSAGCLSLVAMAAPLLWGESYGTQELQRLLSALKPIGDILRGDHGDVRHPAGLFLLFAPAARIGGSIFGLRVLCLALLAGGACIWAVIRWRSRAPGEALLPLGLLLHPVMVESSVEVSPYSAYALGILVVLFCVGSARPLRSRMFALGLAGQALMAATNHVGLAVGTFLMLFYTLRSRRDLTRRALLIRTASVIIVAAPFAIGLAASLSAEVGFRATAERLPQLAWGSRELSMLARGLFGSAFHGSFLWVAAALVIMLGWRAFRRGQDALVLVGLGIGVLGMFLMMASRARVQPSYAAYAVPLILVGLGKLVDSLPGKRLASAVALLVLTVMTFDFTSAGPVLARRDPGPDPAAAVASAARDAAGACPTVLSATNDLTLPLLPNLVDPRSVNQQVVSRDARLPGFEDARLQVFPGAGLHFVSLFSRHRLTREPSAAMVAVSNAFRADRCIQVLYERSLPLPDLYQHLVEYCESSQDSGPFHLFECSRLTRQ